MANRDSGMIIGTRQKAIGMADLVAPTAGPDLIYGTPLDDVIAGLAGDDVIYGVEGDDSLDGNEDNDSLEGGPGNDTLDGGEGDDTLRGGEDDDWLIFSAGADVVDGGAGTDTFDLTGVTANVGMSLTYQWLELDGIGTGVVPSNLETILLGPGDDSVSANTDLDTKLDGGEGNDRLLGLEGNDTLIAGPGLDDLDGNQGDDLLVPGPGRDLLVGGRGTDTLDYSATTLGFTLDINPGPAPLGGLLYWSIVSSPDPIAEIDQVRGVDFEVILGGAGDDHITAFQTGVTLRGMAGNDTLTGDSGSDFIEGGSGADVMDGGSGGDDTVSFDTASGDVLVRLWNGRLVSADPIVAGDTITGFESVLTGGGNDTLEGTQGDNLLVGGAGDDHLTAFAGDDTVLGGDGVDTILAGAGSDLVDGGPGADVLNGGGLVGDDTLDYSGSTAAVIVDLDRGGQSATGGTATGDTIAEFQSVTGSALFGDTLIGSDLNNVMRGLGGDDTLHGLDGFDTMFGGDGADVMYGGDGAEEMDGGPGDDVIAGQDRADTILGGDGNDTISDGPGWDTVDAGSGDDVVYVGLGRDVIDGGPGIDTANFSVFSEAVTINLLNHVAAGASEFTLLSNFENATGGGGDDLVIGDTLRNTLRGLGGSDTLLGLDGPDLLLGGTGGDELDGGGQFDILSGQEGDDTLDGGAQDDFLRGGDGADTFVFTEVFGQDVLDDFGFGGSDLARIIGAPAGYNTFADFDVDGSGAINSADAALTAKVTVGPGGELTLIFDPLGETSVTFSGVTALVATDLDFA
ncbi:hypothetical protein KZZ07_23985 [Mameliella sp. CS4]|uniref:calcium-binding protein n=1 Tax=Mameliella sp. CS4 TaxID=2862329 RepID=UPI001C5FB422|nr:calcium-binding protein [Mameliella sp. CS4]MBW4985606.1 hypothetical protein [Mameliella sp. CS4]